MTIEDIIKNFLEEHSNSKELEVKSRNLLHIPEDEIHIMEVAPIATREIDNYISELMGEIPTDGMKPIDITMKDIYNGWTR